MVGLGILAAGAAQGAAHASNMNVQAQNQLEMGQQREALREAFLNRRFDKELAVSRENSKAAGLLREQEYQRNRADKMTDAEMRHKQALDIEGRRDARSAASNATRLKAAEMRKSAVNESDGSSKGITLPNGEVFTPSSPEYRLAVDMVKSGEYDNIKDAIRTVISKGLISQAAGSIQGLREGAVPTAKDMSGRLFGAPKVERFKLEDLLK